MIDRTPIRTLFSSYHPYPSKERVMIQATEAAWRDVKTETMLALVESKSITFVELASGQIGPNSSRTVWQVMLGSNGKIYRVTSIYKDHSIVTVDKQFWEVYES